VMGLGVYPPAGYPPPPPPGAAAVPTAGTPPPCKGGFLCLETVPTHRGDEGHVVCPSWDMLLVPCTWECPSMSPPTAPPHGTHIRPSQGE